LAFVLPAQYAYGNAGGNILREDNFKSADFSVFKQFQVAERSRLQFRFECFNLANTPSFNAPNANVDNMSGGRVTSTAGSPRQMQVALKYIF